MRIRMMDGRVFEGTGLQIVRSMQDVAFGVNTFTTGEYVAWVVRNARELGGVELDVRGDTDDDLAQGLVHQMVRAGLAARA